jgi:hypothetical protein
MERGVSAMAESKKIAEYRATLHRTAKTGRQADLPGHGRLQAHLEGKAAKLGLEIQGEESKAAPKPKCKTTKGD